MSKFKTSSSELNKLEHIDFHKIDRKIEFLPPWTMPILFLIIAVHGIFFKKQFTTIIKDFTDPNFLFALSIFILFTFFVVDPNDERSRSANNAAIISFVTAYFGYLNLPIPAGVFAGLYVYYTHRNHMNVLPDMDF